MVLWQLWATVCAFACVGGWLLGEAHGCLAGDEAAVGERSAVDALRAEAFGWLGVKEILHLLCCVYSLFASGTYWGNRGAIGSQVIGRLQPVRIVWVHVLGREVELAILLARHLGLLVSIRPGTCRLIDIWHLGLRHLRKLPRLWIWHDASRNTLAYVWSLTLTAILRMILLSALSQHGVPLLKLVCWVLLLRCSLQRFEDQRLLV